MGRVGEPRQELPVGRDEGLGLGDVGLALDEVQRFPRGAREIGGRRAERQRRGPARRPAAGRAISARR
jgi:hypothetical protein